MNTKQRVLTIQTLTTRVYQWCDAFLLQTSFLLVMRMVGTGLGFFFWMYATRIAVPDAIGYSSALISAAMFMASLAQMGFGYVVLRHLRYQSNPSGLVNLILSIIAVMTLLMVSIALGTMRSWFPHEQDQANRFVVGGILLILTMSLALSQIVNWIFLTQQRLSFSLLKQGGQACLALGLIILFQPIGGFLTIMLAYTTAACIVTIVSIIIGLPKVIPQYQRTLSWKYWPQRALMNDALPNYLSDQLQRLPDMLLPLIVVHQAGGRIGAIFFIMWSLGSSISAWASSTADAFLREGTYHPNHLMTLLPRVLMTGFLLTVGLGSILALVSPILLPWYGQAYATMGYPFLLVLLISNVPWVGTTLLITLLRIRERRIAVLVGLILSNGIGTLVMLVLLPKGLLAAGWGWGGVQVVVMLGLGLYSYHLRRDRQVAP
ncbi:hypothetical protein [Herpetosiphon gulosus]|uniref:Polysaccharide biosynthesis protein C-terminal domain-containing protein n=1 Tax=Herpetosiphon gulosus TaxID=1973496 RepID=A0ABP9X6E8_9CHLR